MYIKHCSKISRFKIDHNLAIVTYHVVSLTLSRAHATVLKEGGGAVNEHYKVKSSIINDFHDAVVLF